MDWSGLDWEQVAGFLEKGNELLSSIICGKFHVYAKNVATQGALCFMKLLTYLLI
jgi:hypothetical protein